MTNIEKAKKKFLECYNEEGTSERALSAALNAASQRNYPCLPTIHKSMKEGIRCKWRKILEKIGEKYKSPVSLDRFLKDIGFLKREMNRAFPESFNDPGFKISHAQKSLSVYLKHLWCMREIPEPPACPVDRYILQSIGQGRIAWTRVDDIKEQKEILELIRKEAKKQKKTLAEWELIAFTKDDCRL